MADKTKPKAPKQEFVTKTEFKELLESVGTLAGLVKQSLDKNAEAIATKAEDPAKVAQEKEVVKAGPKHYSSVNPEWEQIANDIIGAEKIERCEQEHLRSGGLLFTVVIKKEFSNAPDEYMQRHKEDRRTREIGAEGIGGVEAWCKLIKSNLSRGKSYVSAE